MDSSVEHFLEYIKEKNYLQWKNVNSQIDEMSLQEISEFSEVIHYYETQGMLPEEQAEKYLSFCKITMQEQILFSRTHQYRYSKFKDVNEVVYNDVEFMEMYMVSLELTLYLWKNNRALFRFYKEKVANKVGKKFLEIGPGHGRFLAEAIVNASYDEYYGIDVSQTSIEICQEHLNNMSMLKDIKEKKVCLKCMDFFDYDGNEKFDGIVMGEILEHVEQPKAFLQKAYDLAEDDAFVFITVPINSPELDHIYLFRSVVEVKQLIFDSGFIICDYVTVFQKNYTLEQAEKNAIPINTAFVLKKSKV